MKGCIAGIVEGLFCIGVGVAVGYSRFDIATACVMIYMSVQFHLLRMTVGETSIWRRQ